MGRKNESADDRESSREVRREKRDEGCSLSTTKFVSIVMSLQLHRGCLFVRRWLTVGRAKSSSCLCGLFVCVCFATCETFVSTSCNHGEDVSISMSATDLLDMSDRSEQSRGRLLDDFEDHRMFVLIVQGVAVLPACAARGASSESHRRVPWCSAHLVVTQKRRWTAPSGQWPAVASQSVRLLQGGRRVAADVDVGGGVL